MSKLNLPLYLTWNDFLNAKSYKQAVIFFCVFSLFFLQFVDSSRVFYKGQSHQAKTLLNSFQIHFSTRSSFDQNLHCRRNVFERPVIKGY